VFSLHHQGSVESSCTHNTPTSPSHTNTSRTARTSSSRTIRKRAIDENSLSTSIIRIRNRNQCLIQRRIASISNNRIDVSRVVILVAATYVVHLAQTLHGPGLVHAVRETAVRERHVCECEVVGIVVGVDAVEPEAWEEGECGYGKDEGVDAAASTGSLPARCYAVAIRTSTLFFLQRFLHTLSDNSASLDLRIKTG